MALTNDLLEDNCRDDITFNNILFFLSYNTEIPGCHASVQ